MSKTNFLKTELQKELVNRNRFVNMSDIQIPLDTQQSVHVYNGQGNYTAEQIGEITFLFNNEYAWYYSKNIEMEFKIGSKDGELKQIGLTDEVNYKINFEGDGINFKSLGENKFLLENIKTKGNISINLNNGDTISWDFKVQNKNSINFDVNFKIDYLKILQVTLERNVENEKVDLLNKEINLKNSEISELTENLQNKERDLNNLDIDLSQEKIKIINLNKIGELKDINIGELKNKIQTYGKKYDELNEKFIDNTDNHKKEVELLKKTNEEAIDKLEDKVYEVSACWDEEISQKEQIIENNNKEFIKILDEERKKYDNKNELLNNKIKNKEDLLIDEKKRTILYNLKLGANNAKIELLNNKIKTQENLLIDEKRRTILYNLKLKNITESSEKKTFEINRLANLCDDKDEQIMDITKKNNCMRDEIKDNIIIINKEFTYIKEKYSELNQRNEELIKSNSINKFQYGINITQFEKEFNDKVHKRHIFILEKKINQVVKNLKINQNIIKDITEENKRLMKINHINKYNEKKLKNSLEKAKMKINKEVNSNLNYERKIKLIKESFVNDLRKNNIKINFNDIKNVIKQAKK